MAVEAQLDILQARRGATRRKVMLRARGARAAGQATEVLIHNISESGLLLESASKLTIGEKFIIDLPDLEQISATVVWASDDLIGCAFDQPVSRAAVSAAQLRSGPDERRPLRFEIERNDLLAEHGGAFGARLRHLRKQRGLSLVEFARRVKVSRPTVWSWEAGKSSPRDSKVPALLDVLGVSEDELYGASGDPPFETKGEEPVASENELQRAISDAKQRVAEIAGTSPDKIKLIIEV